MSIKKPTEQSIVNACLDLLKLRGAFAWRVNQGAMKTAAGGFIRFNRVEGVSDVIGVLPPGFIWMPRLDGGTPTMGQTVPAGRMIAIEAKRPGLGKRSRPEPHQQAFLDAVTQRGGLALCVTGVAELDALLTAEGY